MITWMQKHKKYLVVTIWISTIAFVGAGFVGWGAYDLNANRATSVATVGHRNISVQEFQQKYNQLYDYYASILDGKLTQEKADEMGLENLALQAAIQENLLLNFADDIGLDVSDEDILKYIVTDPNFQKDGKFDKNFYYDVLRRARINPNDFEKNLKRSILLDKLNFVLNVSPTKNDLEMMTSSIFMKDKILAQVVKVSADEVKINEDEVKKLWQEHKNDYMTKTLYDADTLFVQPVNSEANATSLTAYYNDNKDKYKSSDDKIKAYDEVKEQVQKDYNLEQAKTNALEKYIAVKKGELATNGKMNFNEDNASFSVGELKGAKAGDTIKPFVYENGYLIVKLNSITAPEPMSYEQARDKILEIYKDQKIREILEQKAKDAIKDFKGKEVGLIDREANVTIEGLESYEVQAFASQLLESPNKKGYIMLDDKAVVYEILEQNLTNDVTNNEYKQLMEQNVARLKNSELMKDLAAQLQKRYKIKEYTKR